MDDWLARLERAIVLCGILALIVLSSYQIILRNLGSGNPSWIDPLLHHLVLWTGFLGAALAVRTRTHIRMDLLSHRLPPAWSERLDTLISLGASGLCLLLARASWHFVISEREMALGHVAGLPSWMFATIIPAAFALMAFHFLIRPWRPTQTSESTLPPEDLG